MGSDWSWQVFYAAPWSHSRVEEALEVLASAGWRLEPGAIGRPRLIEGLTGGQWAVSLHSAENVDIALTTPPGCLRLQLAAEHTRREPRPEADGYRLLHRGLTEAWVELAERLDGLFGRVEDEWSVDELARVLRAPGIEEVPAPGQWPQWLGWWTYFNAERADVLPGPPAGLRLTRRGAVLALLDDPAAVDPAEFLRINQGLLAG